MQGGNSPITDWINSDVKTANTVSIIMIIFAAWAGIEAISNLAGIEIPPETGMATNTDPDDTQRANNGIIVGLGAVLGTLGIIIQSLIPRGEEEQEEEERGPVFDEDLVKLTKWLCSRGTTTAEFFKWADVDGSGSIDMVEFANALRAAEIANLPPWEIEDLVKLMDINSDGRIDLPELDIALLNIRNALSIEFIPYVEEEKPEDEASEEPEEEVDQTTEDTETEEEAEDDSESNTDGDTEESEDEESELEEAESSDSEDAEDQELDEESELEEAESSDGEDAEEQDLDEESELEEAESSDGEDAEDEEEDSSEGEEPESEETTETDIEDSSEDSDEESETHDDSNTGEEAQGNETAEESEVVGDESDDTEDDSVEEIEESEEETPKKKKKF